MDAIKVQGILLTFENFLMSTELDFVTEYATRMEDKFAPATTVEMGRSGKLNVARRRARVLTEIDTGEVGKFFKTRIERSLPRVLEELKLPKRRVRRISVQITSTGNGDFYKLHTDNSVQDTNRRFLSFVYFCHPCPVRFQGGELRIYSTREHGEINDPNIHVHAISPEQNRIVFFQSDFVHEISPVVCASARLADTRLTVNGWVYSE
jgi:SM-20-related protein